MPVVSLAEVKRHLNLPDSSTTHDAELQDMVDAAVVLIADVVGPLEQDLSAVLQGPSWEHLLGTDELGRDLLSRIVTAAAPTLLIAVITPIVAVLVTVPITLWAARYARAEGVVNRVSEIVLSLPGTVIILAFIATGWASYAKIVRGDVIRTRQLEYVDAARSLGARDNRLILKHIVPNSLASVLTIAVLDLGTVPLGIAALSFLGLGFPAGYAEWGQLVDFARAWLQPQYWYVMVYPAAFIILFSLGFNLFGDALRDAYDPKTR